VAITPGVGIFFTQFNGCISLTFASWKGSYLSKKANLFIDRAAGASFERPDVTRQETLREGQNAKFDRYFRDALFCSSCAVNQGLF